MMILSDCGNTARQGCGPHQGQSAVGWPSSARAIGTMLRQVGQ
jgi:hypothetical protein